MSLCERLYCIFTIVIVLALSLPPFRELTFTKGDIIDLTHTIDDNWLEGTLEGRNGILPSAYVKVANALILSESRFQFNLCPFFWMGLGHVTV